jgi:hypothetical protein
MKTTTKTSPNAALPQPSPAAPSTVPIPDTLQSIAGYPDKLKTYMITKSSF